LVVVPALVSAAVAVEGATAAVVAGIDVGS
jgi:hypothetical protein